MKGSWVALVTPFKESGELDIPGFRKLVDFQVAGGTDGILLLGSTGEASLLSKEEKHAAIDAVVAHAAGRIPIFVGCTANTTSETIEMSRYAKKAGADGLLLVAPSYVMPPQDAIYEFFANVADAVDLPIAVYNNPTRVGVNIAAETIVRLAKIPNVIADKEAMPNVSQLVHIKRNAGDKLSLLCCDYPGYGIIMPTLALGGDGVTNVVGNVIPDIMAKMSQPWHTMQDVERTRSLYFKYLPLLEAAYAVSNPVSLKGMMQEMGLPAGPPRRPLLPLNAEAREKYRRLLVEFALMPSAGKT